MNTPGNTIRWTKAPANRKPVALCTYLSAIGLSVLVRMHRVAVAGPVGVF